MPAGPNEPRRPKWYIKRWFTPYFRHSPHVLLWLCRPLHQASGLSDWVQPLEPLIHVSGSQVGLHRDYWIEFCTSSMYPGRSSQGDYFGFSATSCGAETYYYLGFSATLYRAESYYLDSGGLLWIEPDLALGLILSFGLWGIIMDSAQPCVAPNPIIWALGDYSGFIATLRCAESFFI
ncbi:hypothetical protein B0H14DRAFT_973420 [Mycena olivaceomarginata]|nr:hypothetical protein B0H14DRAFT_973420 [Mycena olivaceomarginata]